MRDLIAARGAFAGAPYATVPAPDGAWAYRRGDHAVALNLAAAPVTIDGVGGTVLIGTDRARDGAAFDGRLGPYEAVVVR